MKYETDSPARVLLVDDQVLYREAMRGLIDRWPEFRVVAEASDGAEAVRLALELTPDLVLMDVRMPVMDGVAATREILARFPDMAVVMLTVESEREPVFEALQVGARGYLLKDTPARKLRDRLHCVVEGETTLSEAVTGQVVDEFARLREASGAVSEDGQQMSSPSPDHLTERERDILRLLAQGKSNEEIATALYVSLGTVKKHIAAIMDRLCLENRVQLAVYAVRAGLDK